MEATSIQAAPSARVQTIAARLTLATLTITGWQPVRTHKGETRVENERHGVRDVVRVSVRLTDHAALEARAKIASAAYAEHRRLTLPTVQEGFRLLAMANRLKHAEVMAELAAKDSEAVAWFLGDYEVVRAEAPVRMNGLYVAAHWPTREALEGKFSFATSYLPCPVEGAWGEWIEQSFTVGEADFRERLEAALRRVVERCSASGPLHQTVFSNLGELLELVPGFDVGGRFAAVAAAVAPLAAFSKDQVVDSARLRESIAKRAAEILEVFGGVQ